MNHPTPSPGERATEAPASRAVVYRRWGDPQRCQVFGPYLIEPLLDAAEECAGTVYRVYLGPGQRTALSVHRQAEEYYFVLSGRGLALINGQEYPLTPGVFLRLPPGTVHSFRTTEEPLEMLDIHTPGCWPQRDTYFVPSPQSAVEPP